MMRFAEPYAIWVKKEPVRVGAIFGDQRPIGDPRFLPITLRSATRATRRYRVEQLVTFKGAAARLAVSPEFLRKLQRLGRLQVVYLGAAVRVPVQEIERLIRQGTIPARDDGGQSGGGTDS